MSYRQLQAISSIDFVPMAPRKKPPQNNHTPPPQPDFSGHQAFLRISNANTHNLQGVSVTLPRNQLVVLTGVSGSGKSSLAFDTIFAEGQRRYLERLNTYARQFMPHLDRPDVGAIEGLSPTVAIDQKTVHASPRSTVGTVTEILDYLRVLYARLGIVHCPVCGNAMHGQSPQQVVNSTWQRLQLLLTTQETIKLQVLSPVVRGRKGSYHTQLDSWRKAGISRIRIDGVMHQLDDLPEGYRLARQQRHTLEIVVDRLVIKADSSAPLQARLLEAIERAMRQSEGFVVIERIGTPEDANAVADSWLSSRHMACPNNDDERHEQHHAQHPDETAIEEMAPRLFSFNSPYGACTTCNGLGVEHELNADRLVAYPQRSLEDGAIPIIQRLLGRYANNFIATITKQLGIKKNLPWEDWPANTALAFLHGSTPPSVKRSYGRDNVSQEGLEDWPLMEAQHFEGLIPWLKRRLEEGSDTDHRLIESLQSSQACPACHGDRLKTLPRQVVLFKNRITPHNEALHATLPQFCRQSVTQALTRTRLWLAHLSSEERLIGYQALVEVEKRLEFLNAVGLGYLTLDRPANTLSGGEAQRIRLASQLGSGLAGVLYVLDEPSIGLHPHNTAQLIQTLQQLRNQGNSVLVVEHDEDTIRAADWIIDLGPQAGILGGHLVAQGNVAAIEAAPESLTGQYLTGQKCLPMPATRRQPQQWLTLTGVTRHNLKNIAPQIPLGCFTAVSGLSGSGKSTLIMDILVPALRHALKETHLPPEGYTHLNGSEPIAAVVEVDQSPIGRTPRSTPATYLGLMDDLRGLFARTEMAQIQGWGPGRFSFNTRGGRCETCKGLGVQTLALGLLPDAKTTCEHCSGLRYAPETLHVLYNGHSIAHILSLTVDEALVVFEAQPKIYRQLQVLIDVGLGYLTLGQAANTLSGGEAQRLKLASELVQQRRGHTVYVLDEPTVGLHWEDVGHLLTVIQRLVDAGHTVLVIEHHLELMAAADWMIDLGPGAGEHGGHIVAVGPPEAIAQDATSLTGHYLKRWV
ncbi:MAG: excinuclease ABC subunit UvrA [Vampirovibrionales bacterium]